MPRLAPVMMATGASIRSLSGAALQSHADGIPLPLELPDFAAAVDLFVELEVAEDLVLGDLVVAEFIDGAAEEGHHAAQGVMGHDQLGAVEGWLGDARDADA